MNIRAKIDIFRPPEQNFFHFMRLQTIFDQIRICKVIPSIWENGIHGNLADDAMIPVPEITAIGI